MEQLKMSVQNDSDDKVPSQVEDLTVPFSIDILELEEVLEWSLASLQSLIKSDPHLAEESTETFATLRSVISGLMDKRSCTLKRVKDFHVNSQRDAMSTIRDLRA